MVSGAALAVSADPNAPADIKVTHRTEINFLIVPPVKGPRFA
jgi:hypothetical protein